MELIRSIVASSKVINAFYIPLHIVRFREVRNAKNITKRRKMPFFLNSFLKT